jgi:hypothetical protein
LKPYYEIFLEGDEVIAWASKEVRGPERPRTSIPNSIYDAVPAVKEQLNALGDRSAEEAKRQEQERREAEEPDHETEAKEKP